MEKEEEKIMPFNDLNSEHPTLDNNGGLSSSLALQGVTEFIATFLFIAVVLTKGKVLPIAIALAAAIYFTTHISKGSLNPAISIALYGRGDLSWKECLVYILAEVLAGVAALHWYYRTQCSPVGGDTRTCRA